MPSPALPVLIFARVPESGRVKTRLIPAIGAERAADLHAGMLRHTIATALAARLGPVSLWCTPTQGHAHFRALADEFPVTLVAQRGDDLGERMLAAFEAQTDGTGAVLVGSDCPFLEVGDLQRAAGELAGGADAVIGPAADGGYYLIAVRSAHPHAFAGVPWGGDGVLAQTRVNLERLRSRWVELDTRHDIDRPEDLALLDESWVY
jgi:rSAM/selenodomain-associated transferase 1